MLKVLIADDEKMICSLISQLLEWDELGFEIVGMAYTGIDAYEKIQQYKPDIVISDIRMPGFDGIELIKRTKESGILSEFIMISGFKQFEYAQSAMKYGVKYYLLKPIEEDKLREIVLDIKENIQNERKHELYRQNLETEIKETRDKMKKRFLSSLVFEKIDVEHVSEIDKNRINKEFSTSFQDGIFQAIFLKVDVEDATDENIYSFIDEIERAIPIVGDNCKEYISMKIHSGTLVLLNYEKEEEAYVHRKIEELYEEIKDYAEQFKDFSVVMGVGQKSDNFFQVNMCIRTAIDAIKYRIRFNNVGIIYYEKYSFEPYDIEKIVTMKEKQELISRIEAADYEGAEECLKITLRKIRYGENTYSPVLFFDMMITYVNFVMDYCKKQNYYNEEYQKKLQEWNVQVDNVRSEQKLMEITRQLVKDVIENIDSEKKEKDTKPVRIIKKYIKEHYTEEISLNLLAEELEMNASYLSSVFKKEKGMTYSEYLISCRIDHACKLLVETNWSMSEIATQSGYQDARYFSKQFLKQVGLKPSEYRKLYS